jgi:FAD/FMN-containing dehydrogenase
MMVLGFEDLLGAVSAAPAILKFSPVALEMLDHTVISREGKSGDAGCLLFVEFAGESSKIEDSLKACREELAGRCTVLEYASDEQSMMKVWGARKGALNAIMKLTVGSRKPIGLIEDTVVRPELLAGHASNLLKTYRENKLDYVMYGHVGDGNMHTRPLVDTSSGKEVELINKIAGKVFEHVTRSGGTITGEHGDGLARVGYIEMMYGKQLVGLFSDVKRLLDPAFMLNPGKKVPVQ